MAREYTGRGDPRRSIVLLWATGEPRAKPGLSAGKIVDAAIAIADREGVEALSMRRVARELGAGVMSLYRHVPGKGELLDLMFDQAVGETVGAVPSEGTWRERLEAIAWESWRLYHRHPWVLQISAVRPPLGPNVLDSYEEMLRIVDGLGLTGPEMNATVTLVSDFVDGAARRAVDAAQAAQHSGETDESWWNARASFWEEQFDPDRYAVISRIYAEGGYEVPDESFSFGLARILDGIEARLRDA
jgi:AcrR family transcriptional regulator